MSIREYDIEISTFFLITYLSFSPLLFVVEADAISETQRCRSVFEYLNFFSYSHVKFLLIKYIYIYRKAEPSNCTHALYDFGHVTCFPKSIYIINFYLIFIDRESLMWINHDLVTGISIDGLLKEQNFFFGGNKSYRKCNLHH